MIRSGCWEKGRQIFEKLIENHLRNHFVLLREWVDYARKEPIPGVLPHELRPGKIVLKSISPVGANDKLSALGLPVAAVATLRWVYPARRGIAA